MLASPSCAHRKARPAGSCDPATAPPTRQFPVLAELAAQNNPFCRHRGPHRQAPVSAHNESSLLLLSSGRPGVRSKFGLRRRVGGSHRGLPRGRVWPSPCRTARSFVLATLRALHLDLRRRRRHGGSDRGMPSPALSTGRGRRVVGGPGSGLSEVPVLGG